MADTTSPQSKLAPALGRGVTPSAAAELCHVHPNTIRRWIAEGRLPAYRVGPRRLLVDLADVDALIVPTADAMTAPTSAPWLAKLPPECADAVREAVATAPPLTDATRDRIAAILRGGAA